MERDTFIIFYNWSNSLLTVTNIDYSIPKIFILLNCKLFNEYLTYIYNNNLT